MVKNKETDEQEYLERFLITPAGKKWYEENRIVEIMKTESPDFLFQTAKGEQVALEITDFIAESDNGKFTQSLTTIGNQVCAYAKKTYNVDISIIVDKFDQRMWSSKWSDHLARAYNPGFPDISAQEKKEMKKKLQEFVDTNIEVLKNGYFAKDSIQVGEDYFNMTADAFPSIAGKYDCHVNNTVRCAEDPFREMQDCINKKNNKIQNYLKKCDSCFLLIVLPSVGKGNSCCFTSKLQKHKFKSEFASIFLYNERERTSELLRT